MFCLTRQEKGIVLFLLIVLFFGMGIDFTVKKNTRVKTFIDLKDKITRIDLNKADKQALIELRGIGEKLAARIIAYREKAEGFRRVEELRQIKGLSGYRYEQIKEFFCVNE